MSLLSDTYKMSRLERQTGCIADFVGNSTPPTSNLFAWYKAEEAYNNIDPALGTIITVDGTAVDSLKDLSGNGYHLSQGTAGERPTLQTNELNGFSVVRFDGTDDHIDYSGVNHPTNFTWFAVFKQISWTDADYILADLGANVFFAQGNGSPNPQFEATCGTPVKQMASTNANLTSYMLASWSVDSAGTSYFDLDGNILSETMPDTTRGAGWRIAWPSGALNYGANIDIAEWLIYNSSLSLSSGSGLAARQYLNAKYNLGLTL